MPRMMTSSLFSFSFFLHDCHDMDDEHSMEFEHVFPYHDGWTEFDTPV